MPAAWTQPEIQGHHAWETAITARQGSPQARQALPLATQDLSQGSSGRSNAPPCSASISSSVGSCAARAAPSGARGAPPGAGRRYDGGGRRAMARALSNLASQSVICARRARAALIVARASSSLVLSALPHPRPRRG